MVNVRQLFTIAYMYVPAKTTTRSNKTFFKFHLRLLCSDLVKPIVRTSEFRLLSPDAPQLMNEWSMGERDVLEI